MFNKYVFKCITNIFIMKYMLFKQTDGERILEMSRAATSKQIVNKEPEKHAVLSKYFPNSITKKSKRFRSAFTTEQINYLEGEFRKFPYIGSANRKEVANKLKIPERAVKIWFQNRRMKEKKEVNNKALDIDEISKHAPTLSNEPLNNMVNWQSHNGRCCSIERPKTCRINFPSNITTSNCIKLNGKICPSNKSLNSKEEISAKCFNKPISVPAKRINNTSVAFQKPKTEPKIAPLERPKPDVKDATTKKQNKDYTNCPSSNTNFNIVQDIPQDLSSRNIPKNAFIHHYHHPINTLAGTGFIPLQNYSPTSLPRNVIWKPVNVVSPLAGLSTSVPVAIPHNNSTRIPVVNHIKNNCGCNCNCHVTPLRGFSHVDMTRIHPQYVIAIPYNNPSKL